jgi:hypothetical protein
MGAHGSQLTAQPPPNRRPTAAQPPPNRRPKSARFLGDTIVMKASTTAARICGAFSQQKLHICGVIHSKKCNFLL